MVNEVLFLVQESSEGGFEAKAAGYSIFTQAETLEELKSNVVDAVRCHFEEDKQPRVICLHMIREEILTL